MQADEQRKRYTNIHSEVPERKERKEQKKYLKKQWLKTAQIY